MQFWLCLATCFFTNPATLTEETITPLPGALWEGVITLKISGPLYSQYLANKTNKSGIPVGFIKEKGKAEVDYMLEIRFLVNSLGEHTLLAKEHFQGDLLINNEFWYKFEEEVLVERTRTRVLQNVQVSENTDTYFKFNRQKTYGHTEFHFGSFRVQPSGKMDKKGVIKIIGDLTIEFKASGRQTYTKERQPPSKNFDKLKEERTAKKTLRLPVQFEVDIAHRKKPVQGNISVKGAFENPFAQESREKATTNVFRNKATATGSYKLTPLFGKK